MKTFIKLQDTLIRISTINRVWYEHEDKSYLRSNIKSSFNHPDIDTIIVEYADGSKSGFSYSNHKEYIKERSQIEAILLE